MKSENENRRTIGVTVRNFQLTLRPSECFGLGLRLGLGLGAGLGP